MGKDSISELFRQRFQGHELPVDPAVWQAVQGRLPEAGNEALQELFRERFSGHEVPVDPGVWQAIGSQLGHPAAAGTAAGGSSGLIGWAAAGLATVLVGGALYLGLKDDATPVASTDTTTPVAEQVMPPTPPTPATEEATSTAGVPARATEPPTAAPVASVPSGAATPPVVSPVPEAANATTAATAPSTPGAQEPARTATEPMETLATVQPAPQPRIDLVEHIIEDMTARSAEQVRSTTAAAPDEERQAPVEMEAEEEVWPEEVAPALPVLFLPNTFTPNGDGVNDTYEVLNAGEFGRIMTRVFDVKNNQLVFSTNTNEPWTGANCTDGYYLVAVEAVTLDGRLVTEGKVVWLNRFTQH